MEDTRIDELVRKDEIIDIANSLFIYTDEKNWEGIKGLFADNLKFIEGNKELESDASK